MNMYYLIAGLLVIFLSVAHASWGEKRIFALLKPDSMDDELRISLYVPWHQISYLLFLSGVTLILAAFSDEMTYLPRFILAVIAGNFTVFVVALVMKKQTQLFSATIPQTILFVVLMGLIALGILSSG
jgi:hypothetical protein